MRNLILQKIQELKTKENGFENSQWDDFFIFYFHISIYPFEGAPDGILFDIYNAIMDWNSEYMHTGKAPIVKDNPYLEELKHERKTKTGRAYESPRVVGLEDIKSAIYIQKMGRINRL